MRQSLDSLHPTDDITPWNHQRHLESPQKHVSEKHIFSRKLSVGAKYRKQNIKLTENSRILQSVPRVYRIFQDKQQVINRSHKKVQNKSPLYQPKFSQKELKIPEEAMVREHHLRVIQKIAASKYYSRKQHENSQQFQTNIQASSSFSRHKELNTPYVKNRILNILKSHSAKHLGMILGSSEQFYSKKNLEKFDKKKAVPKKNNIQFAYSQELINLKPQTSTLKQRLRLACESNKEHFLDKILTKWN